jgi:hypothetical protein
MPEAHARAGVEPDALRASRRVCCPDQQGKDHDADEPRDEQGDTGDEGQPADQQMSPEQRPARDEEVSEDPDQEGDPEGDVHAGILRQESDRPSEPSCTTGDLTTVR